MVPVNVVLELVILRAYKKKTNKAMPTKQVLVPLRVSASITVLLMGVPPGVKLPFSIFSLSLNTKINQEQ